MGRLKTIFTTLSMSQVYEGDLKAEVREKYRNTELPGLTSGAHRHLVSKACELAEKADTIGLPEEEIRRTLIYFGAALDAEKHRLDIRKFEEDYGIRETEKKVNDMIHEKRKELRDILNKADEMITAQEWERIKEEYRLQKDWKKSVSENWHMVITGRATKLAKAVIAEGGTEEEVKLALTYLKVCIDVNKYLLDYTKFRQENGIVELTEKYL